jgi:O-antigen/teichoic acid export membrane protein
MSQPENEEVEAPAEPQFRASALGASAWAASGVLIGQVVRLGANLILTRLLFPDAFGMMAIVNAVIIGLEMFSDVGIAQSIIQHERDDVDFLDTAWSVQVVRGIALWAFASILAYPISRGYGEPLLMWLIPVAASSAVIRGLAHTSLLTLNRELGIRALVLVELSMQIGGAAVMLGLAYFWRSVWPLAIGGVVASLIWTVLSYMLSDGRRPRFHWEQETLRDMAVFGRWIFLSSLLAYLLGQGDRLVMGAFMSMGELGVYSIAALVARQVEDVTNKVDETVLFPIYSRVGRTTTPELLSRVGRYRIVRMALFLPAIWILIVFGDDIVELLWDERYWDAGWMVQIISAGTFFFVVSAVGPIHLARGESWVGLIAVAIRASVLLPGMVLGGYLAGAQGLIIAIAASYVVYYPLQVWISIRYRVWLPLYDLAAFAISALVIWAGLTFT